MKDLKVIAESTRVYALELHEHTLKGLYEFSDGTTATFIVGDNESGCYEHASVAPINHRKIPTWSQMCEFKDLCFKDEEEVVQVHPPKSEYVNIKENCLHLWRRIDGRRMLDR